MDTTKIALLQCNLMLGNIEKNTQLIIDAAKEAKSQGATMLITPELALSGGNPEDLLFNHAFWQQIQQGLDKIEEVDDIAIVVGHPSTDKTDYYNSASVFYNGNKLGTYHKTILANEGTSDEVRYFEAGLTPLVFTHNNIQLGLLIGEDTTLTEPAAESKAEGAEILVILNASPFYLGAQAQRIKQLQYRSEENNLPIISVNMVGGQNELVFDGASFVINSDQTLSYQATAFEEQLGLITLQKENNKLHIQPQPIPSLPSDEALLYQAVVLATRDYIQKSGFKKICLGLSGGIDSALVLAIAADAIGAENCEVIIMPSIYTAQISVQDAEEMAKILNVKSHIIPINPLFEQFKNDLIPLFSGLSEDTTEENLQARIRGSLLMALSNKSGALLLCTGNKSELATGYCTLYGDMNGGFAVIKDLLKTQVYALSRYRNTLGYVIPERIITRAPSAELKQDQKDQDSLPEYEVLDAMLKQIMELNASKAELLKQGFQKDDIEQVIRLLKISEYKRRQGAVGPKVSMRAFGKDWRMPICQGFYENLQ